MKVDFIHPKILTILGTYKCTAECENCCFASNPRITKRLTLPEIISSIKESLQFNSLETVVFSGGECFLLGNDLVKAVEYVTSNALRSRCVTNGYWAKSMKAGRRILTELKLAGLSELNISTGDFHQKFVSEDTIINAASLGIELGITTLIVVELQKDRKVSAESLLNNPKLQQLTKNSSPQNKLKIIESPWMPMDIESHIEQREDALISKKTVHLRKGCNSIFTNIVINPNKKLGLCCGLPREKIPELNFSVTPNDDLVTTLRTIGKDFFKIWLYVDGPERILAWAGNKNPSIKWENRFSHHCHACLAIFSDPLIRETIFKHYKERINDVLFRYSVLLRQQELLESNNLRQVKTV